MNFLLFILVIVGCGRDFGSLPFPIGDAVEQRYCTGLGIRYGVVSYPDLRADVFCEVEWKAHRDTLFNAGRRECNVSGETFHVDSSGTAFVGDGVTEITLSCVVKTFQDPGWDLHLYDPSISP